jgi:hypothetical protein
MKKKRVNIDDSILERGVPFDTVKLMTGNQVKSLMKRKNLLREKL